MGQHLHCIGNGANPIRTQFEQCQRILQRHERIDADVSQTQVVQRQFLQLVHSVEQRFRYLCNQWQLVIIRQIIDWPMVILPRCSSHWRCAIFLVIARVHCFRESFPDRCLCWPAPTLVHCIDHLANGRDGSDWNWPHAARPS